MAVDLEEQDPEINPGRRKKSAGEHVFDRTVYTGIGFGVNELSSLWITDQFVYGKNLLKNIPGLKTIGAWFSEEGYTKASDFIAKTFRLVEKTASDGVKITPRERGGNTLLMVTLLSGGTLLILPMKWLEDNKIKLVEKANHLIDRLKGRHLSAEETAERDEEVKMSIACSPRQSWSSMMVGRVIACICSVSSGTLIVGKRNNDKLMNWSEKLFTGSIQPAGQRTGGHRYARLVSVETYSCTISSLVLEIISKFTAKRNAQPHDQELCEKLSNKTGFKPASSEDTDTRDIDCGCTHKQKDGFHAAKIQSRKAIIGELQPAQI